MAVGAYLVCATPRSGSTLLCDLLAGTGAAGRPDSFYRRESIADFCRSWGVALGEGVRFERRYLAAVITAGTDDTGMFGMRLMWPSLRELTAKVTALFPRQTTDGDRIAAAFGTPVYIHLRRCDRIGQAVSRSKAEQSGLWHRGADGSNRELARPYRPPRYDAAALKRFLAEIDEHEAAWSGWFAAQDIAPLELTYEELSDDPAAALAYVLAALGCDPTLAAHAKPMTARLADAQSRRWAARFAAECRRA
ncbi:MAG TPA: Stf0 family sulfotransferase [Alphaproteobacteria bacterium]|nr:Stf0 family sulfotransferase [Alphaproteobacteria bacterium]